jgi:hypothetical protein
VLASFMAAVRRCVGAGGAATAPASFTRWVGRWELRWGGGVPCVSQHPGGDGVLHTTSRDGLSWFGCAARAVVQSWFLPNINRLVVAFLQYIQYLASLRVWWPTMRQCQSL